MPSFFQNAREPMSSYTHWLGAIFSFFGTLLLIATALLTPVGPTATLSVTVFGLSLVALYCASAYYHFVKAAPERLLRLRKLDHAMIYVLIAGSYTPLLLAFFPGEKGVLFTIGIWVIAAVGISVKLFWFGAPRWLSTCLYLLMGWAIVLDLPALGAIPTMGLVLLSAGGISYTIGGLVYIFKKPNIFAAFGFHELFHVFVLIGSFLHFLVVYLYVLH